MTSLERFNSRHTKYLLHSRLEEALDVGSEGSAFKHSMHTWCRPMVGFHVRNAVKSNTFSGKDQDITSNLREVETLPEAQAEEK
jgi:hypothetical protein